MAVTDSTQQLLAAEREALAKAEKERDIALRDADRPAACLMLARCVKKGLGYELGKMKERAEKAEKERDKALARGRLLQEALVSPAFPDDDDLDFMDRMPERSSGGKAGEEAWWLDIAERAGYRGCMKALIGIWEVGRSETKLVKDALAGFRPIKTRTE